jgi:hypothetical protein
VNIGTPFDKSFIPSGAEKVKGDPKDNIPESFVSGSKKTKKGKSANKLKTPVPEFPRV